MSEPVICDLREREAFRPDRLNVVHLFADERFFGTLVCLEPGQAVPIHTHPHKDEAFDVVEGEGEIRCGERVVRAGPGSLVFVPAGTAHGLANCGAGRWLIRETAYERVYARQALRMALAAAWRRVRRRPPARGGD